MSDPTIPPASPDPIPPTPPGGVFETPVTPTDIVTDPVARQWGLIAHLSALAGYVIPFGNIVGPLIVWQMKKEEIPFAADQAKEALNFHISVSILIIICLGLMCVVIGFFLLPIVGIGALVFMIIAAVKANKGIYYRYPFALRLIK